MAIGVKRKNPFLYPVFGGLQIKLTKNRLARKKIEFTHTCAHRESGSKKWLEFRVYISS